jgi:hypothetical protein
MDLALETKISHLLRQAADETKVVEQLKSQARSNVAATGNFQKLQSVIALHSARAHQLQGEAMAALASRK